ncbi:hypothetical protein RJT34_00076 [Clitoria ternatea]|uniref:Uncharacterized protein n=1 Tax=Clitoria ternatea TaxID=43366 RepID=A0AAN9PXU7_CLITE
MRLIVKPLEVQNMKLQDPAELVLLLLLGLQALWLQNQSYQELANATNNFNLDNKIGQGGFGVVYYAELRGEYSMSAGFCSMEACPTYTYTVACTLDLRQSLFPVPHYLTVRLVFNSSRAVEIAKFTKVDIVSNMAELVPG